MRGFFFITLHKQSVKTFYQCAKFDLIVSCNEKKVKNLENMFRCANSQFHVMIETLGKSQAT